MNETERLIEDGYCKIAQRLVNDTIWEAHQLSTIEPGTKRRNNSTKLIKLGLGHNGTATPERIEQLKQDLDDWIGSDEFFVIARKLGHEVRYLKQQIRNVLYGGPATPEWKKLVEGLSCYYAVPRGNKKGSNGRSQNKAKAKV